MINGQAIATYVIVAVAGYYVARRIFKQISGAIHSNDGADDTCGIGCGCAEKSDTSKDDQTRIR